MRYQGQVVLVSGSGIGAAIAGRYCEEGAAVAILDRNVQPGQAQASQLCAQGARANFVAADVADFDSCDVACREVQRTLGAVDILISNSGISPKHDGRPAPIHAMDPAEWKQVVSVNLTAAFNLSRLLTPA